MRIRINCNHITARLDPDTPAHRVERAARIVATRAVTTIGPVTGATVVPDGPDYSAEDGSPVPAHVAEALDEIIERTCREVATSERIVRRGNKALGEGCLAEVIALARECGHSRLAEMLTEVVDPRDMPRAVEFHFGGTPYSSGITVRAISGPPIRGRVLHEWRGSRCYQSRHVRSGIAVDFVRARQSDPRELADDRFPARLISVDGRATVVCPACAPSGAMRIPEGELYPGQRCRKCGTVLRPSR